MTLTDEIYRELMDGLRNGVEYDKLRLRWEGSKGPFYNALQKVFAEAESQFAGCFSEMDEVNEKIAVAKRELTRLENVQRKIQGEVEAKGKENESLRKQEGAIRKQIAGLDSELKSKDGLLKQARELQATGLNPEQLRQVHSVVVTIGTKRGLKPKQAVDTFFSDLEDYDAKIGFEREIQRLETVTATRRLEAERCQAEKQALDRAYSDRKRVISAMEFMAKHGVKAEHVVAWNKAVEGAGGMDRLMKDLSRYKSVKEALAAEKKEVQRLHLERQKVGGEANALREQSAEIRGIIEALSAAGVTEIVDTKETALCELTSLIAELRKESEAHSDAKAEAVRLEKELTYARYLTGTDELLRAVPKTVVEFLLGITARYCRLTGRNPRVEIPDFVRTRNSLFPYIGGVALADLVEWAQKGLAAVDPGLGRFPVRRDAT